MPSSTFSSSAAVCPGPWARIWLLTVLLVGLGAGAWEGLWRWRGVAPSVKNETDAWVAARLAVQRDSVVLVGTSRILANIHPATFAAATGQSPPIHLGIPASSPLPVLEDLAGDEAFAGQVIVDFVPRWMFAPSVHERLAGTAGGWTPEGRAREYLQSYYAATTSPSHFSEIHLRRWLQMHVVFRRSALSPSRVFSAALQGRWPDTEPAIGPDRFTPLRARAAAESAEASPAPAAGESCCGEPGPGPPAGNPRLLPDRDDVLRRLEGAVTRIRDRGGKVVFVQFPVSPKARENAQRNFPRALYWDEVAKRTAAPAIHSEDFPALANFTCVDDEHLSAQDAALFTRRFADILLRRLDEPGEAKR